MSDQMICEGTLKGCTDKECDKHDPHPRYPGCHLPCAANEECQFPGSRCVPVPAAVIVVGEPDRITPGVVAKLTRLSTVEDRSATLEPVQPDSLRVDAERLRDVAVEVLALLRSIQNSYKASIGSIHNTYTPQLSVEDTDLLTVKLAVALEYMDMARRTTP